MPEMAGFILVESPPARAAARATPIPHLHFFNQARSDTSPPCPRLRVYAVCSALFPLRDSSARRCSTLSHIALLRERVQEHATRRPAADDTAASCESNVTDARAGPASSPATDLLVFSK